LLLDLPTIILLDGSYYKCYTVPQYSNPSVEGETIRIFIRDPVTGTLMTGCQGNYQFSLYIQNLKLYYKAVNSGMEIVTVSTDDIVNPTTFQIYRNLNSVEISMVIHSNNSIVSLATMNITVAEFGTVRFTDICIGGGLLDTCTYSGPLQEVYYNLYYLSGNGTAFNEKNVSVINRVNFVDPNAQIQLPGNLADGFTLRIELSFRTSQLNAILLHSEDDNNHFRISINNSQVYVKLLVNNNMLNRTCDLTITPTNWYRLIVELIIGSDASEEVLITLVDPDRMFSSCGLQTSLLSRFSSTPIVVGGMAGGVDGLVGCLELMFNSNTDLLNLEHVLSDTIHTDNCQPCDIPDACQNGGSCQNVDDRRFTCNCVAPYFGDFCGKYHDVLYLRNRNYGVILK